MAAKQTLAGKVALITGASKDSIGRAMARRLAAHGASIVVHASGSSTAGLIETRDLVRTDGGRCEAIEVDLGDADARSNLVAEAASFFGPVDILVNNAARTRAAYQSPSTIDLATRRGLASVNFEAPIDLSQQALPHMREAGWGRIVNITSGAAEPPMFPPPMSAEAGNALTLYGATKAALDRYTLGLALELHNTGITVNATKPYAIIGAPWNPRARDFYKTRPEWVEPIEMLAEAVYVFASHNTTGLVMHSRDVLRLHQAPLYAVDGVTVLGDASTLLASFPEPLAA